VRVHRILGRARFAFTSSRVPRAPASTCVAALAALVFSTVVALDAAPALAYCRTTTCAVASPPTECIRDLNGCYASGIPLFWRQRCLTFSVGAAGSPALGLDYTAAEALIRSGFELWPNADCAGAPPAIAIMSRGPLMCDRREYNSTGPNANAVLFRDTGWPYDGSIIALTSVVFNSRTGDILGADMEINSGGYPLTPINVEYVVAHESGHFYGLDHSSDPSAIMYFEYGLDRTDQPVLTQDDNAAICAAYPPARITPECTYEPPKGFATDCGGNVIGSCAVVPASDAEAPQGGRTVALALVLAAIAGRAVSGRRNSRKKIR